MDLVDEVQSIMDNPRDFLKEYWDDASGNALYPEGIRKARAEEMGYVRDLQVYSKVPISECWAKTGRAPIGTRWIYGRRQQG